MLYGVFRLYLSTTMSSAPPCYRCSVVFMLYCLAVALLLLSSTVVVGQIPHSRSRAYQQQEELEVNRLVSHPTASTPLHSTPPLTPR